MERRQMSEVWLSLIKTQWSNWGKAKNPTADNHLAGRDTYGLAYRERQIRTETWRPSLRSWSFETSWLRWTSGTAGKDQSRWLHSTTPVPTPETPRRPPSHWQRRTERLHKLHILKIKNVLNKYKCQESVLVGRGMSGREVTVATCWSQGLHGIW